MDLQSKRADFAVIGVGEAWIVRPPHRTGEVLTRTSGGAWISAGVFGDGQRVVSVAFPDLTPLADDFFKP